MDMSKSPHSAPETAFRLGCKDTCYSAPDLRVLARWAGAPPWTRTEPQPRGQRGTLPSPEMRSDGGLKPAPSPVQLCRGTTSHPALRKQAAFNRSPLHKGQNGNLLPKH